MRDASDTIRLSSQVDIPYIKPVLLDWILSALVRPSVLVEPQLKGSLHKSPIRDRQFMYRVVLREPSLNNDSGNYVQKIARDDSF